MSAQNKQIRVFTARACEEPLQDAAELFEEQENVEVAVDSCSRHCASQEAEEATGETGGDDFLLEISDAGIHDLAIGGAEYLMDDGVVRGVVQKGERRTIARRRAAIIVPEGNPAGIRSVEDLAEPEVDLGVSVIDCLKGLWEDAAGRCGLVDPVQRNISYYANGCVAIIEAVADGTVDAAFGWTAFKHLAPDRIDAVELPEDQAIERGTSVGLLKFSDEPEAARQFMDFLTTPEARECYQDYGWVL